MTEQELRALATRALADPTGVTLVELIDTVMECARGPRQRAVSPESKSRGTAWRLLHSGNERERDESKLVEDSGTDSSDGNGRGWERGAQ